MRNMNCRNIRREIEEASSGRMLSRAAISHLETCSECETLSRQQANLRAIVSSLGTVEVPGDFDLRLRARLAAEKRGNNRSLLIGNLSFGLRSAAVAAMLLLVGAAFLFVSLRTRPEGQLTAGTPKPVAGDSGSKQVPAPGKVTPGSSEVANVGKKDEQAPFKPGISTDKHAEKGLGSRQEVATQRAAKRIGTLEVAQKGAQILTRDQVDESYPTAPFSINASYQSLKVSVDDRRGAVRTISLPSVSFGSQRTLSQNSSPLLASSRGDW